MLKADSAKALALGAVGDMGSVDPSSIGFSDIERSAIEEIGNILTSGFVDGWANVLETTIDTSTPTFIFGPGSDMIDDLVGARGDDVALMFDSRVCVLDSNVNVTVYTFPELDELVGLMKRIEV